MTDDDKTLVARLRWSASGKVGAEQARLERNAADRIEAQAAEIEELKSWKAAEDAHHHKLRAEIETLKTMIFATGEAAAVNLRTAMERALEIERLRDDLLSIALSGSWDECISIARASLGETDG